MICDVSELGPFTTATTPKFGVVASRKLSNTKGDLEVSVTSLPPRTGPTYSANFKCSDPLSYHVTVLRLQCPKRMVRKQAPRSLVRNPKKILQGSGGR